MRVGVAWVEADGFAVGRLSVYVAVLTAKPVPCVLSYCSAWAADAAWREVAPRVAGGVGERVPGSLGAGAPGGVLGQERLKQVAQRAARAGAGPGERVKMAAHSAVRVAPSNGGLPSTAVYKVAPSAHISAAAPAPVPSICSGAMYSGVPIIILVR